MIRSVIPSATASGVGCGFTANLLIVTTDVLLSGISTEAAKTIDTAMHVSVIDNWYFMASSVVLLTLVGGLIPINSLSRV